MKRWFRGGTAIEITHNDDDLTRYVEVDDGFGDKFPVPVPPGAWYSTDGLTLVCPTSRIVELLSETVTSEDEPDEPGETPATEGGVDVTRVRELVRRAQTSLRGGDMRDLSIQLERLIDALAQ
jgi:hypothetical protein